MIRIFHKEINNFLNSMTAYIVIMVFLIVTGLILWFFPDTSVLEYGYADMDVFFTIAPYVLMFLVPAITMKMFSEEKKSGTLEILFTRPLTDYQIILGKYLASISLLALSILPTSFYYLSLYQLGNPPGNLDTPGIIGSYIGLFLLGSAFASIGLFSSTLTENQVIAFLAGVFFCFILFDGLHSISRISEAGSYSGILGSLSMMNHYLDLGKGLIDFRDVFYFLSVIVFMIALTKLLTGSRKWD